MTEPHDTHTSAVPLPGAGPAMRMLDVAAIVASGTNPRKTFNAAALQELANSIAASGVHQPVLVRPLPASRVPDTYGTRRRGQPLPTHELVAGERRWRACQLASVQEIPAMIRELTDAQVLEIQIVENLQREDVSELEEAEGYGYLMQQTGLNAEEVGGKIGKAMEQQGVQATLVANPHAGGALVAVLLPGQVNELLKAQGHADAADKLASEAAHDEKAATAARRAQAQTKYEETWRWDVLQAAWRKLAAHPTLPTDAVLRHIATDYAKALNVDRAKRLCKLLDLGKVAPVDGVEQWAANHPTPGAALQLLVMEDDAMYRPWLPDDTDSNAGLLLVAAGQGLCLDTIKDETKANLRADAARAAAAAKSASTPCPAAQASSTREAGAEEVKGKGKAGEGVRAKAQGKTGPAAHARAAVPKTSKAQAGAGAGDGAAMSTQGGPEAGDSALMLGMVVRVLPTATRPKQLPHVGAVGSIYRKAGDRAWEVRIPGKKTGIPKFVTFDATELELVP